MRPSSSSFPVSSVVIGTCCQFFLVLHLCDCKQEHAVREIRIPFFPTFLQTSFASRNYFPCRYTPLLMPGVTSRRLDLRDAASCVTCRLRPGPPLVFAFVPLPSSVGPVCRLHVLLRCLWVFRVFVPLRTAACFSEHRWCHCDELH